MDSYVSKLMLQRIAILYSFQAYMYIIRSDSPNELVITSGQTQYAELFLIGLYIIYMYIIYNNTNLVDIFYTKFIWNISFLKMTPSVSLHY